MKRTSFRCSLSLFVGISVCSAVGERERPVETVASHAFSITTARGSAEMPFEVSLNWNQPQPQVTRAVVMFHGKGRDVEGYYRATVRAAEAAGGDAAATSILIAPQFLNEEDTQAHRLPGTVLRWREGTWEAGTDAAGRIAISAYEVIDAIVRHLSDRHTFPNLKTIVLAGHSGGGQAIQRYAVAGRAEQLTRTEIHLRYVVANPSSYLYFTDDRPQFAGESIRFEAPKDVSCHNFNHWKYGPLDVRPDYVRQSAAAGWQRMEDAYARKDVVYLLGTDDIDPHEKDLDVSCAGELEGPSRFLRGRAYYAWLHGRHAQDWKQRMWFAPGVAHSGSKMFTSECGVAALFERSSCSDH